METTMADTKLRNDKFITLKQAALEINATRRFLERRVEIGELKVFKPSRRLVRVSRDELSRWITAYSSGGLLNPTKAPAPAPTGKEVAG